MKPDVKWTTDCQGKKNYDGEIVSVSSRYWPRGGGYSLFSAEKRWEDNGSRPATPPSAQSSIIIRHGDDAYLTVTERTFSGETFEDLSPQVEAWAQEQFARVVSAVHAEFRDEPGAKEALSTIRALREDLALDWPFGYSDEEVAGFGQGKPNGETWALICEVTHARDQDKELAQVEDFLTRILGSRP